MTRSEQTVANIIVAFVIFCLLQMKLYSVAAVVFTYGLYETIQGR